MDEHFAIAHEIVSQAYFQTEEFDLALAEAEKAVTLSNRRTISLANLAFIQARLGKSTEAANILDELLRIAEHDYVSAYDIAMVYVGLHHNDEAFLWLNKALREKNGWLVFLNIEPRLDALRDEERFSVLLRKVGFLAD
jgi:tetratricopeptide (TPR) repeat protein